MIQDDLLDDNFFEPEYDYDYDVAPLRPGNFAILFLASFGLYGLWWMYKQWRFFKEKDNLDIYPIARAFFAIFFLHSLFEEIQKFAQWRGYHKTYSSTGLFILFLGLNFLSYLPDPAWLLSLLGFLAFLSPIKALNFALRGDEMEGIALDEFNGRQWALLVVGGLLFVLSVIGVLFGA